jgi:hypothetical protein
MIFKGYPNFFLAISDVKALEPVLKRLKCTIVVTLSVFSVSIGAKLYTVIVRKKTDFQRDSSVRSLLTIPFYLG